MEVSETSELMDDSQVVIPDSQPNIVKDISRGKVTEPRTLDPSIERYLKSKEECLEQYFVKLANMEKRMRDVNRALEGHPCAELPKLKRRLPQLPNGMQYLPSFVAKITAIQEEEHSAFLNLYLAEIRDVFIPRIEASISAEMEGVKAEIRADTVSFPSPDIVIQFYESLVASRRNNRQISLEKSREASKVKFEKRQAKRKLKANSEVKESKSVTTEAASTSDGPTAAKQLAKKKGRSESVPTKHDSQRGAHRGNRARRGRGYQGDRRQFSHRDYYGHHCRYHEYLPPPPPSCQSYCDCHGCNTNRHRGRVQQHRHKKH